METKKILMVTTFYPPYHVGGADTHVYYLANALAKKGHEIHVFYSKDAYYLKRKHEPDKGKYQNHENVTLHELKTPTGKLSPLYSYVSGKVPFKKNALKLFNQKYDLIHHHNISLFGPEILRFGKSTKIYTAHDHWFICPLNDFFGSGKICTHKISPVNCAIHSMQNNRPPQLWRFSDTLNKSIKDIEMIISPSNYLKNFLSKNSIKKPIKVIPNFVPDPPKKIEKNPVDDEYFFFAGMLEQIKGLPNLLEAFSKNDKKLVIAGKGSLQGYMIKFIKKNKLTNKIIYVDWLEDKQIYSYYKNALSFILPSICPENSPLSIMESLSVGTPAMGSDVGGIPEIISKLDGKLVFKYNDVDDLRKKTSDFRLNGYTNDKVREIHKKYYSTNVYLKSYLKLINNLAS